MKDKEDFFNVIKGLEGKPFSEYIKLIGDFDFSRYVLKISRVQDEQDEQPTLLIIRAPQSIANFPAHLFNTPIRRTALEDILTRKIAAQIDSIARYDEDGVSRRSLSIACPGQKILPRSSMVVTEEYVEARIYVDLPSRQGLTQSDIVRDIFFEDLPQIVNSTLIFCNTDENELENFVDLMEDADRVRQILPTRGWVSYLAEGAMLCRLGHSDLPDFNRIIPLAIDSDLILEVEVPNTGSVRGIGIPAGITVILGDAYSGRIELMRALASGVYNHIPGDGREMVITVPDAVYVAAEAGRSIQKVDVSPFITELPSSADPKHYTCPQADRTAAQAASTVEAMEVGARVLMFDESESCAEFLGSDSRLAYVSGGSKRNVTPLALRARQIADEMGISIVVAGSTSVTEFIPIADTVLRIHDFKIQDVTKQAKQIAITVDTAGTEPAEIGNLLEKGRWVAPSSIDPSTGCRDAKIAAPETHLLEFGRSLIDLSQNAQLADIHQTKTIGRILYYAKNRYLEESRPIREVLDLVDRDLSTEGLESLSRDLQGDLARPRRYEIAAALNRLETLRIVRTGE